MLRLRNCWNPPPILGYAESQLGLSESHHECRS
jgi:hypothetical protein